MTELSVEPDVELRPGNLSEDLLLETGLGWSVSGVVDLDRSVFVLLPLVFRMVRPFTSGTSAAISVIRDCG